MKQHDEFEQKRRLQATDWMWALVMDELKSLFLNDRKVAAIVNQLQTGVSQGQTSAGAAARRLIEAFKRH